MGEVAKCPNCGAWPPVKQWAVSWYQDYRPLPFYIGPERTGVYRYSREEAFALAAELHHAGRKLIHIGMERANG